MDLASSFISNFKKYLTKNYTLKISFYCVSKADKIHEDVYNRAEKLKERVLDIYDSAEVDIQLINAQGLTELYRKVQSDQRALTYQKSLGTDDGSYVCLATLSDYYEFISSDDRISREIFDANVRDHQGNTPVNNMKQLKKLTKGEEKRRTINNTRFYAMYLLVKRLQGRASLKKYLAQAHVDKITKSQIKKAVKDTLKIYSDNDGDDQFAKSAEFLEKIKEAV